MKAEEISAGARSGHGLWLQWVPANALAWAPGMVLAFVAADFIFANGIGTGEVLLTVITLAVIGAVVGAIHGAALVWLLRFHRKPG